MTTTTVGDIFSAAEPAAGRGGKPSTKGAEAAGVRGPDARTSRARARLPVTLRVVQTDVAKAWVWRDSPPSLRQVAAGWASGSDQVPAGSGPLRAGRVVWNVAVAVPATAILYVLAWLLQHPARAAALGLVAGSVTFMWIK
jgi:hypothetical protein